MRRGSRNRDAFAGDRPVRGAQTGVAWLAWFGLAVTLSGPALWPVPEAAAQGVGRRDRGGESDAPRAEGERSGARPGSNVPNPEELAEPAPEAAARTFPFSDAAAGNAPMEARLDSVRVEHGDGRPSESMAVRHESEGPYFTVGDMGRLGDGFRWNPETWRGSLIFDSTEVGFSLDSPVFWVRGSAIQTPAPVRYRSGAVLVPLSFIDAVVEPLFGERCDWEPSTGRLVMVGPAPWITALSLEGSDLTGSLLIGSVTPDALRLRWDPQGVLLVEIRGARLPADHRAVAGRAEGAGVAWVHCTGRGSEIALRLDDRWAAVRVRGERGNVVRVEWTSRVREVQSEGYQPLGTYAVPARSRGPVPGGRIVLLEVGTPPSDAGTAAGCLAAFADVLAGVLSQEFGHTVIRVPDRGVPGAYRTPAGLPETPGIPAGDCWIGLRLEGSPANGEGEFSLVVPSPPARREPLRLGSLAAATVRGENPAPGLGDNPRLRGATLRVPPWGQVARAVAPASTRLARTVADHLDYSWAERPVRISARPARIFRGVGIPAVLIYPAATSDSGAIEAICDETRATDLARNLAYAVDEFLMSMAEGE